MGLLGVSLGARVRRGGRGAGLVLGFAALIIYQLVALVGEQLARKGTLPPLVGVWLGPFLAIAFSLFWLTSRNTRFAWRGWWGRLWRKREESVEAVSETANKPRALNQRRLGYGWSFPAYLDWSTARTLTLTFLLTLAALTFLFLTFTLFELWRFITPTSEGYWLMARYLFYLLPLTFMQTLPGAGMIAALATYALMARRLESVAWQASGLSAYRLMLPGLLFALALSGGFWFIQEKIMPPANLKQDALRASIKGNPKANTPTRQWLAPANGTTLYSYNYDDTTGGLRDLSVYTFADNQTHLKSMLRAGRAQWNGPRSLHLSEVEEVTINGGEAQSARKPEIDLPVTEVADVFKPAADKPSQLSAGELRVYVKAAGGRGEEVATLATALQTKYAAPFGALALMILGAPLALAFDRRRILNALGAAVIASLIFWILGNFFQQLGARNLLPPVAAAWIPTALFGCFTVYLFSRTRT